jgi:ABC-type branched-subunit amino acid transport system substrate-binding protein
MQISQLRKNRAMHLMRATAVFPLFFAVACNQILGLDDLALAGSTADASYALPDGGAAYAIEPCTTNLECSKRVTAGETDADGGAGIIPAMCMKTTHRCVRLLSEDCTTITGDYTNDDAIVIGSMFSTTGAQATTNLARQQSAILAVEEINAAGGVPAGGTSAGGRPLVMVSCDEAGHLLAAGSHLVRDLAVPAIIGPNTSQDTLDLSKMLTITGGTLVISPTAVASSISDLIDQQLTWLMVPSDVQRAPLMIAQINALETQLAHERDASKVKLGVIFRDDALGVGTRVSLNALVLNGKPLSDAVNLGTNVRIDGYDFKQTDQSALVHAYLDFAPDILVVAGTAESITNVIVPLEQAWPDAPRPYYVLIDSAKTPELIAAVTGNDDLRRRIRGTGVTPGPQSQTVYNAFKVDYELRYPDGSATISGMGPSYDATYAVAYALAATKDSPASGANVALGLRKLAGGPTRMEIQGTTILAAFQKLVAGDNITAVGTFGPLEWNANGAVVGGTIEMWCIGVANGTPVYQSSGLMLDVASGMQSGTYKQCAQ